MSQVRANGIDIAYESIGRDGDPAILMIHGLATPLTGWPDSLCEGLAARGFRVVRFDNRDVGRSAYLTALGMPDLPAIMAKLRAGHIPPPRTRSTTWPPTRRGYYRRSALGARISSAPRWAA